MLFNKQTNIERHPPDMLRLYCTLTKANLWICRNKSTGEVYNDTKCELFEFLNSLSWILANFPFKIVYFLCLWYYVNVKTTLQSYYFYLKACNDSLFRREFSHCTGRQSHFFIYIFLSCVQISWKKITKEDHSSLAVVVSPPPHPPNHFTHIFTVLAKPLLFTEEKKG